MEEKWIFIENAIWSLAMELTVSSQLAQSQVFILKAIWHLGNEIEGRREGGWIGRLKGGRKTLLIYKQFEERQIGKMNKWMPFPEYYAYG
jgi:hypothetical protein